MRLAFGLLLLNAGGRKLFTDKGHANIIHLLEGLGIPAPGVMAWVVGLLEFGGGLGLLAGAWIRPLAVINIVNLLSNLVLARLRGGLPAPLPGEQPLPDTLSSFLGIGGLLSLYISGAGAASIEELRAGGHAVGLD
jgi:putative oxidoreductase